MTQPMQASPPGFPRPPDQSAAVERPLRELLVELWEDTEKLVRQEVKLASVELDGKVAKAKADVTTAAIGGAVLYAGLLALVAGVILLLATVIAPWLAALVIGAVTAGIGFAMTRKAKDLDGDVLVPQRTIRSLHEDVRTFKEAMR